MAQEDEASTSEKGVGKTPDASTEAGTSEESAASRNLVIIVHLAHRASNEPEFVDKLKSAKSSDLKEWGIEGMTLATFRKVLTTAQNTIGRTKMATEQSSSSSGATFGTVGSVCSGMCVGATGTMLRGAGGGNVASGAGTFGTVGSVGGSVGTAGSGGICYGAAGSTPVS